jgi:uncharacterized protein YmfQ (DUF2313 family)
MTIPQPRTPARALQETLEILPTGAASTRSPNDYLGARFAPLANELSLVETSALSMLPQIDPRAAPQLLPDWQRMLGPDTCQVRAGITDETVLANLAYQQLTDIGGPFAGRFIALAEQMGIDLTIAEFELTECGVAVAGTPLIPFPENEFFEVSQPLTYSGDAIAGIGVAGVELGGFPRPPGDVVVGMQVAGQALGGVWEGGIGCVIRSQAPLHLVPVFTYTPNIT